MVGAVMKPRLKQVQWTYEDIQVWVAVAERLRYWLTGASCESDRRDAELMLYAQEHKSWLWAPRGKHSFLFTPWVDWMRGVPVGFGRALQDVLK
jgi:hypothetical protein